MLFQLLDSLLVVLRLFGLSARRLHRVAIVALGLSSWSTHSQVAPRLATAPPISTSSSSAFSHPREQTKLDFTITAASDLNPDDKGRAAPVMVRIYELRAEGNFESADYFALHTRDKALLGADLLVREEFIMRPGEVRSIRRKSHPDLAAIGVLVGYRDLAQADWRSVQGIDPAPEAAWYRAAVPANKVNLRIDLHANGVRVTPIR
jgi:type VI secretion system protein VasD